MSGKRNFLSRTLSAQAASVEYHTGHTAEWVSGWEGGLTEAVRDLGQGDGQRDTNEIAMAWTARLKSPSKSLITKMGVKSLPNPFHRRWVVKYVSPKMGGEIPPKSRSPKMGGEILLKIRFHEDGVPVKSSSKPFSQRQDEIPLITENRLKSFRDRFHTRTPPPPTTTHVRWLERYRSAKKHAALISQHGL